MEKVLIGGILLYLLWKDGRPLLKEQEALKNVAEVKNTSTKSSEPPDEFKDKDQVNVNEKNTSTAPISSVEPTTKVIKEIN